jgi:hypothetical protein
MKQQDLFYFKYNVKIAVFPEKHDLACRPRGKGMAALSGFRCFTGFAQRRGM